MKNFKVLSKPKEIFKNMLEDIRYAQKSIYLETYIYENDKIGNLFLKALEKKARQGVKVFVLIDALGSGSARTFLHKTIGIKNALGLTLGADKNYFRNLRKAGGKVRFFKEIRYAVRWFGQNHERNHRKLLIIDRKISYIGSVNITSACLDWRELVLRLEGDISGDFVISFAAHWRLAGKITRKKINLILHKGFEIIQDIPSDAKMITADRYIKLIRSAKKEILIETPYFVPPITIRKALSRAVEKGVQVKLLIPCKSDLGILDIIRNRYLGRLYMKGIKIYYYLPRNLHSKLLIIDDKFFILGSSNLDYRALIHQYEINLLGKNKKIISELRKFFNSGLKQSKPFDYREFKSRSSFTKLAELIVSLVENYL
ncbi:phosphatidylserine/phosphatidylglycerophosphate/cardiolipin synthase family protein [Candidatus Pacearchaeota archaeon]|nr:phosphatidylserine/phosphatidylglycerophosphate/cardiolipin synthase family protein [Candidatus Pacearchaeota archaeon]